MSNNMKAMFSKQYALFAAFLVIAAVGSFYGRMRYQAHSAIGPENFQRLSEGDRPFTLGGTPNADRRQGANVVQGEIIAKDEQSITVKLLDGGSKIIFFSETTNVGKINSGTASDLLLGEQVTVNGLPNDDGSVTAQMIQIRPSAVQRNDGASISQP